MPTGNLPASGKALFERVYGEAKTSSPCKDAGDKKKEGAARVAWTAVKNAGWKKDASGNWHKAAELEEFSLTIKKAVFDEPTQEMRWRADTSDIDDDSYGDNMTLELFADFVSRIGNGELAPEPFRSDFWQGGMPYLSVSHYPYFNGKAVPGSVDNVYMDGKFLKAVGKFADSPIGRACFNAACKSVYSKDDEDKVRISIAFLDWMHKHKSNSYIFERSDIHDFCPECLKELINGEYKGKTFLKGQLVHLAQTKVPVNKRTEITAEVDKSMAKTRKEDAASIIGEELADELEELANAKVTAKREKEEVSPLVIKADKEVVDSSTDGVVGLIVDQKAKHENEPSNKHAEDEEYPDCKDEKSGEMDKDCVKMHKEKKSKAVEPEIVLVAEADMKREEKILDALTEIKSILAPKEAPAHPLDDAILRLKADYDNTVSMEVGTDEKLQSIQPAFNEFANKVVELIKSTVPPEQKTEISTDNIAEAIAKAILPLAQKMEFLSTQMQQIQKPVQTSTSVIPERRAINPALVQQSIASGVAKSETPKLRALI